MKEAEAEKETELSICDQNVFVADCCDDANAMLSFTDAPSASEIDSIIDV